MRGLWVLGNRTPAHHAFVFHCTSLVFYLFGGVLVFLIARRLARDDVAAALGASAWLLLPVHAEDVLYAYAFCDVLSMVFQLGGLLCVMRALDEPTRRYGDVVASLILFTLAVFVKEMAVTTVLLVPAFIVSERWPLDDKALRTRAIVLVTLHVVAAFGYLLMRTLLLGRMSQDPVSWFTLGWALAQLPRLVLFNLEVALMPLGHAPDYGGPFTSASLAVLSALVLAALAWSCLRRSARGVRFGALLFVIALAPVLQIMPMWTLLADRFLLVPSVGIAVILAAFIASVRSGRLFAVGVVVAFCLVSIAGLSLERRRFQDDLTFWSYAVSTVDDSALAHQNLGVDYLKHQQPKEALAELIRSYQLGRREPRLMLFLATGFEGIGNYAKAEQAAREAIALDPQIPMAYAQLASILRHRGDAAGALAAITEGQRRGLPPYFVAKEHASALRADPSRQQEALRALRALSRENPDDMMVWAELGDVALRLGLRDEALRATKHCGVLPACLGLGAKLEKPNEPAP
jgi:cytochrome c-type biogenesis protein CcmH/NrfG